MAKRPRFVDVRRNVRTPRLAGNGDKIRGDVASNGPVAIPFRHHPIDDQFSA